MGRLLKILLSAYACEPGQGSEPGVGWNWIKPLSRSHEVWVITRTNNRPAIDAAVVPGSARFVYCDLPGWVLRWKKGKPGILVYYYLWQFQAFLVARKLHATVRFDVVHHVTFVKYWMPSFLSLLSARFIWGPVGGGESTPPAFLPCYSFRGRIYERLRDIARSLGEIDPFVLMTARRAAVGLATTNQTAARVRSIGCRRVELFPEAGLTAEEIHALAAVPLRENGAFRILSVGDLLHLKGFELSLRAFARFLSQGGDGEYWLIGDGPERRRLAGVAVALGVQTKVRLWGRLPRSETLLKLAECDVLAHPSLHDSGGWVCLEAMAAGRPVVCLDLGGPGVQVTPETGIKVVPRSPGQVIADMAEAFKLLSTDTEMRTRMCAAGRRRVSDHFSWDRKSEAARRIYELALKGSPT